MKCNSCGNSLKIEYKLCPNCGTPNPYYKEHRENMEKYGKAFENTQKAVIEKTKKQTGILVKIAICAFLFAASILMLVMTSKTYSMERSRAKKDFAKNETKYMAELAKLEADRAYIELNEWFELRKAYMVDATKGYRPLREICSDYAMIFDYACDITNADYMEVAFLKKETTCNYIAERYGNMLKKATPKEKDDDNQYTEEHLACMNDCIKETRAIIQATFKISDEEMEGFDEMSDSKRGVLLEDHWPYAEEEN